jgi:hypothetical protein
MDEAVEPLKGWKLNHVQFVRGSGTAQIGYLDPEDDRFSPIVTVDTGLYYRPQDAAPLASAILAAIATPTHPAAEIERPADALGVAFGPGCRPCGTEPPRVSSPDGASIPNAGDGQ